MFERNFLLGHKHIGVNCDVPYHRYCHACVVVICGRSTAPVLTHQRSCCSDTFHQPCRLALASSLHASMYIAGGQRSYHATFPKQSFRHHASTAPMAASCAVWSLFRCSARLPWRPWSACSPARSYQKVWVSNLCCCCLPPQCRHQGQLWPLRALSLQRQPSSSAASLWHRMAPRAFVTHVFGCSQQACLCFGCSQQASQSLHNDVVTRDNLHLYCTTKTCVSGSNCRIPATIIHTSSALNTLATPVSFSSTIHPVVHVADYSFIVCYLL